jgi:GNAT superfamily N-acetyltransferase
MSKFIFPLSRVVGDALYDIDTDKARLDRALIHRFLVASPWANGIPRAVLERAIDHSIAFGLYRATRQVGFARIVTDFATFAYIADVFVMPEERGKGLGRWLVETMLAHPELQGLRRWLLGTRSAHGLYRRCGFAEAPPPFSFLERHDVAVYEKARGARRNVARLAEPGLAVGWAPSCRERSWVAAKSCRRPKRGASLSLRKAWPSRAPAKPAIGGVCAAA